MAEEAQERTEQATPRKKQKAREKGDVAKSRDLSGTLGLLGILAFFFLFGPELLDRARGVYVRYFSAAASERLSPASLPGLAGTAMTDLLLLSMPPAALAMTLAFLAHMVQVGFLFTTEPLAPKPERIDPVAGFKRLFSAESLAETVKGLLKVAGLALVLKTVFENRIPRLSTLPTLGLPDIVRVFSESIWAVLLAGTLVFLVLAVADYGFQRWNFERKLRMSRQEIKEEHKEQEGDPLIRARIRSIQREMARRRMMEEVPKATVVLTNPTRIAVALRYGPGMQAPTVTARGMGWLAGKIREKAREAGVPVIENKPLARALHRLPVGAEIPEELYRAVAEVLAYVYRRSAAAPAAAPEPGLPG